MITRGPLAAALVSWGASVLVCATVAGQTLADVARAEGERRKAITQPSRLYTNKDLKPVPPSAVSSAESESPVETPGQVSPRARGESPGEEGRRASRAESEPGAEAATDPGEENRFSRDEARWRRRIADAREAAERSRTFAEALQSRINALTADFSSRDDPAQRAAIGAQLNKALAELERVRGEIEARGTTVVDLEEEARRAGVPPGWLR